MSTANDSPWDEYDPNAKAEQEAGEPRKIPDDMVRRSWVSPGCKLRDEIAYAVKQYWPEAKARRLVAWMDREMDYRHARSAPICSDPCCDGFGGSAVPGCGCGGLRLDDPGWNDCLHCEHGTTGRTPSGACDMCGAPPATPTDDCEICHGERGGVPGNENHINGVLMCDYCHSDRIQ